MRIGIVGAGHAGVEAARAAREAGADVTLFSAEDSLPYYRPRLVALAFGQAVFDAVVMHPAAWYAANGIDLRLGLRVEGLDAVRGEVATAAGTDRFDGLVLASGGSPVLPPFVAGGLQNVLPLWDKAHADAIRRRVGKGRRLVVVGGGILGIEAALRALDAGMRVEIVERMDRLMPAQFGSRASSVLFRRLTAKGVAVRLACGVGRVSETASGSLALALTDGAVLEADLCLVCVGARPCKTLPERAALRTERGVLVSPTLQTSGPLCFAAGDAIQYQGLVRCSAREAGVQGRIAGANVVSFLKGEPEKSYAPQTLPLMFRSGDFELYSVGDPGGDGCEEHLLEGSSESVIRSLIRRDGIPVGVQMIGTREGFDRCADLVVKARGP